MPLASVGLSAVMVTVADADLVGSVTEVAVSSTVLPGGIVDGAVYVVTASFAVVAGLKEPHSDPPQVTVHFTWGLAEVSFVIIAFKVTAEFTSSDAGMAGGNETTIGMGGTILMVAETDLLVSAAAVAVSVTVLPEGMFAGAV